MVSKIWLTKHGHRALGALAAAVLCIHPVGAALACSGGEAENSADVEDQIQQGYFLDRQGDYQAAIDAFHKVLEAHPDNRKAHYFLANTLWRDNNFLDSSNEWLAVLRMDPGDRIGREAREWLATNQRYIHGGAEVLTVAGGTSGYADGPMATARFNNPRGMVLSPTGNLYIADTDNHRIRRITPDGQVLTVAGTGQPGIQDGPAQSALLTAPHGLALDAVGNLYFCDGTRVRFVTPDGQVGTMAGTEEKGWRDGPYQTARFWAPSSLAVDGYGNVYVADGGTAVRQITPAGEVHLLAGSTKADYRDGIGESARFRDITAMVWTPQKVLIVADAGAHRLRAINASGEVKSLPGCSAGGYVDGPMANAHFGKVTSIVLDRRGNLLLADASNYAIRRVNAKMEVETIAGGAGSGSDDGRGIYAHFKDPTDVAVYNNTVFVLDRSVSGVRRITLGPKDM